MEKREESIKGNTLGIQGPLQSTIGKSIDFRLTNNDSKKLAESSNLDLDSLGYTKTLNKDAPRVPSPSNNSFVNESEPELAASSK